MVSRSQLIELGLEEGAIYLRLRRGRLHRLHSGVYAVGHGAVTRKGRWMAATLASGPGAVLSHRSAADLWGIRPTASSTIDVTIPRKGRSRGRLRRHHKRLAADEVTTRLGIPVTTVPRTIFDLASVLPVDAVEAALREAEYLRLEDRVSLHDLIARYPGHRGSRAIRACLARRDEDSVSRIRSPLEERFLLFLRRRGLPRPRLNAWIEVGEKWFQVDCLWPEHRVIVELDGGAAHGTKTAFHADRARDRRLQAAGYRVVRITWRQLEDEPEEVAQDLRATLAAAS